MYLMTHSLLSAWRYSQKENPYEDETTERDSMAEFMQTLQRVEVPQTDAMLNGIQFENLVTSIVNGEKTVNISLSQTAGASVLQAIEQHEWYKPAKVIADRIAGGRLQHVARKEVELGGEKLLLYGRLDALKAGGIYDIKFSKSYDRGKYLDSTQHPMYMTLVPEADSFTYLVSNGTDVWSEQYRRDETPDIIPIVRDFLEWLKDYGLMDTYREHWRAL